MKLFNTLLLLALLLTANCSIFKKKDETENIENKVVVKKKRINPNTDERAKEARDRGITIFGKKTGQGGVVSFATSNVMWRASLEVLDFMPLDSIDYAGGVIATDWYKKNISDKEEIKIRVQFLSDDLAVSSIKVVSHKRICNELSQCRIVKTSDKLTSKIKNSIINKARQIKISDEEKSKK